MSVLTETQSQNILFAAKNELSLETPLCECQVCEYLCQNGQGLRI